MSRVDFVRCSSCGKRASQDALVEKEQGLVIRAFVQCPECVAAQTDWQAYAEQVEVWAFVRGDALKTIRGLVEPGSEASKIAGHALCLGPLHPQRALQGRIPDSPPPAQPPDAPEPSPLPISEPDVPAPFRATAYERGPSPQMYGVRIEQRAEGAWAITCDGWVLNRSGRWEREPRPSSRSGRFIERTRWSTARDAALAFAQFGEPDLPGAGA